MLAVGVRRADRRATDGVIGGVGESARWDAVVRDEGVVQDEVEERPIRQSRNA